MTEDIGVLHGGDVQLLAECPGCGRMDRLGEPLGLCLRCARVARALLRGKNIRTDEREAAGRVAGLIAARQAT